VGHPGTYNETSEEVIIELQRLERNSMNGNDESKSGIESESNRYGPQTEKVRDLLDKTDDEWLILLVCWMSWSDFVYGDGAKDPSPRRQFVVALNSALDEAERSGRNSIYVDLLNQCREMQAQSYLAIVLEDRIGELFTQEHYDFLTTPFSNFWVVVNNTEPGTPLRELTLDLMRTFSASEALREAKRTLG